MKNQTVSMPKDELKKLSAKSGKSVRDIVDSVTTRSMQRGQSLKKSFSEITKEISNPEKCGKKVKVSPVKGRVLKAKRIESFEEEMKVVDKKAKVKLSDLWK